jgi:hypothetical protein
MGQHRKQFAKLKIRPMASVRAEIGHNRLRTLGRQIVNAEMKNGPFEGNTPL